MPENQPQPQQKTEFMGAGWGSDLMRKWKSLGQNIGVQNVALARLLNKLSEDMGFSPPPSNKIKTRGGPGAVVEAISGPVANPKSITGAAVRVLKQYAPEFAKKVKNPIMHNTGLTELMKIAKSGGLKGLRTGGAGGREVVSPISGRPTGSISLTRSAEEGIPRVGGLDTGTANVQMIYDTEDIRKIGKLTPHSWYGRHFERSAKAAGADEAEEVFRQRLPQLETVERLGLPKSKKRGFPRAYKDTPIIPNEILRGLVIRGGWDESGRIFPSPKIVSSLSQLDVPTVLTPEATSQMMMAASPQSISRSATQNIIPTYEAGRPESTGLLMQLLEYLGQQAR